MCFASNLAAEIQGQILDTTEMHSSSPTLASRITSEILGYGSQLPTLCQSASVIGVTGNAAGADDKAAVEGGRDAVRDAELIAHPHLALGDAIALDEAGAQMAYS